jgi:hypothetical protein
MTRLEFCQAAIAGADRAERLHGPIQSSHHAHGILLEEIEEYWDEVRKKRHERDPDAMFNELIDVGVCCVRWVRFLDHPDTDLQEAACGRLAEIVGDVHSLHEGYSVLLQANLLPRAREPFPWVDSETALAAASTVMATAAAIAIQLVVPMKAIGGNVRRICVGCRRDLEGSDPSSPVVRHGVCNPPCEPAIAMGFRGDAPTPIQMSEVTVNDLAVEVAR